MKGSFFLGQDADLLDMVLNGHIHPLDANGISLERSQMNEQQRKDHKNHHESINVLFHSISYSEYENILNKDSTKSIFDSLKRTHEVNKKIEKSKDLDSFQKDEVVIIE